VLAEARARPNAFVIGVDAVADAMADSSRRAGAKPSRGGVENAMFLCGTAEALPGALVSVADEITVNYPWGSLLRALALPDVALLAKIASLGKPGATFNALTNIHPLRDAALGERLGLTGAKLLQNVSGLTEAYARAGFEMLRVCEASNKPPAATSWGKHLAISKRETWKLEGRVARR
jgi:16S rRNA (adenine(1408)-N(1))-methyltransferase